MYLYKSGLLPHSFNTVKPLLGGSLLSGLLSIPKFASIFTENLTSIQRSLPLSGRGHRLDFPNG